MLRLSSRRSFRMSQCVYLSLSSDSYLSYVKLLHKKFQFLVHPDFFTNTPVLRDINAKNLMSLQEKIDSLSDTAHTKKQQSVQTRALIFYIKTGASMDMPNEGPRRVKIGLKHVHDSLRDILDDYYMELPPRVAYSGDSTSSSSSFQSFQTAGSLRELATFLDELFERRDLLKWREERKKYLLKLQDVLQEILGVDDVQMRYNWSAHSNAKTYRSLLLLLADVKRREMRRALRTGNDEVRSETLDFLAQTQQPAGIPSAHTSSIFYPWSGLTLVFTNDDCSSDAVNAREGEIRLSPGHVPLQWLETITAVNEEVTLIAKKVRSEIAENENRANQILSRALVSVLLGNKQHSLSRIDQSAVTGSVTVRLRRGFTCSKTSYAYFLHNLVKNVEAVVRPYVEIGNNTAGRAGGAQRQQTKLPGYHESPGALLSSESLWMSQLPLEQELVVELGHGSRLLATGEIRVDARTSSEATVKLLERYGLSAIKGSALQKHQRRLIKELADSLCHQLGLLSITLGAGVTEAHFHDTLESLLRLVGDQELGQKLHNLRGLNVRVGMYLGFSDEGSVIIPHSGLWGQNGDM